LIDENYTYSEIKVSPCPIGCTPVRVFITVEQFSEIQRLKIDLSDLIQNWIESDIAVYQHDQEEEPPVSCKGCRHHGRIKYKNSGGWIPYCDRPDGQREMSQAPDNPDANNTPDNDAPEWCPKREGL
jgi:hypothetical protein